LNAEPAQLVGDPLSRAANVIIALRIRRHALEAEELVELLQVLAVVLAQVVEGRGSVSGEVNLALHEPMIGPIGLVQLSAALVRHNRDAAHARAPDRPL